MAVHGKEKFIGKSLALTELLLLEVLRTLEVDVLNLMIVMLLT